MPGTPGRGLSFRIPLFYSISNTEANQVSPIRIVIGQRNLAMLGWSRTEPATYMRLVRRVLARRSFPSSWLYTSMSTYPQVQLSPTVS